MKRFLLMAAAATAMLTACEKTEMVPTGDAQEISFVAVNQVATKAPVNGTDFLTSDDMDVVAYLASGDGATAGTYFTETKFTHADDTKWTGKRYWPLSDATINFLAVTNTGGGVAGHVENVFTTTQDKQSVVSTLSNNDLEAQTDLMYAAGQGRHNQGTAYTAVDMKFKHALSWINFTVKTGNGNDNNNDPKITINFITLNDVNLNGKLTLDNPYYATVDNDKCNTESVTVVSWTDHTTEYDVVLNKGGITTQNYIWSYDLNSTETQFGGDGILIIPSQQTSFTINYTITQPDGTANSFNYTHKLSGNWDMSKKYVYKISMTLTEIQITPSITDWDASHSNVNQGVDLIN